MIKSPDIRRFIAEKMKKSGFNVIASGNSRGLS